VAATITPQHLLENRNYLLGNGLRPHAYCKPILKKEEDRIVLVDAATSGNPRFFLGTDSAPHPKHGPVGKAKETDCGCAGCFTAHAALELYAEAFEKAGQLDRLHAFASRYGADFYELPHNSGSVTLIKRQWNSQPTFAFGTDELVPFRYEQPLSWRMLEN
jgi:dihydroorotase